MCTLAIDSIVGKHNPLSLDTWNVLIKICLKQDSGRTSPAIESIAGVYTTVSNFWPRWPHDSVRTHETQIRFMLFKGPGPFKKKYIIGGNVDELKAYRLIPLTPPLFFHFTLPLRTRSGVICGTKNRLRIQEKYSNVFGEYAERIYVYM